MLVNCSKCHTPLQLPPGAKSIRCAICRAITLIADPHTAPPTPPSAYNNHYYPPPSPALAPSTYSSGQNSSSRKRAVIVGISYTNTRNELKGCINDAKCMKFLLTNRFNFPQDSILMLTGIKSFQSILTRFILILIYNSDVVFYWLCLLCPLFNKEIKLHLITLWTPSY